MPTKQERAAKKAEKEQVKKAKAEEKARLKAEKEQAKADKKAAKDAKKADKAPAEENVPDESNKEVVAGAEKVEPIKFDHIVYEGKKIVTILPNKHTATHFHCRMSDNSTCHVPKSLFE